MLLASLSVLLAVAPPQASVEDFGAGWEARWAVHASAGNSITAQGDELRMAARENTFAHASRPLGRDLVRVSAAISPGLGISWCTSLFLYWGPGNWCQLGINRAEEDRWYAVEMVNGRASEHVVGKAAHRPWQRLMVELGDGVVRYGSSEDGRKWTVLSSVVRPAAWKGAPARLMVGKGYGTGAADYPKPDLENDYADPGPPTTTAIRTIRIEATPAGLRKATAQEVRQWKGDGPDTAGDKVLAMPGDPTFDRIKNLFPAMKNAREAVGVKDHPYEFVVEPDGAVLFGNDVQDSKAPRAHWEIGDPPVRLGGTGLPIVKKGQGWLPIVRLEGRKGDLKFRAFVWGWSEGMSPDAETWAFMKLVIRNTGKQAWQVPIRLSVRPASADVAPAAWTLDIPPGGTRTVEAKAPYGSVGRGFTKVEPEEETAVAAQMLAAWNRSFAPGVRPGIPEPPVEAMWRKSLVHNWIDVDKINGVYEPHDGSGFYEAVYGVSAALYCNALDLWGFHADAKRYLDSVLTFVQPDGQFMVNSGLLDLGALLYAMSQHAILARDTAWLRRVEPKMTLMADWLIRQRRATRHLEKGKRPLTYGLIKFRPYCDFPSPTFGYVGDCYGTVGLEWTARAFARAGLKERSARLAREAAAYRADVLASMARAVVWHGGMEMLPMEPDTQRLLRDNGYTGGEYYGLVAGILLETGFLPPDSRYAKLIVALMEKRKGLMLRMCEFAKGIDHAYTYGYWLDLLKRDEVRPVLVGFYGTLAYGMSRETFSAVECTDIASGLNAATTPHLYSGTQQLRLLRMMLVHEDGDTLWLAQATPRSWLENGKSVSMPKAPTLFGPVSYVLRSEVVKSRIVATVRTPSGPGLRSVRLRLRCPEGYRLASATVNGKRAVVVRETISLLPDRSLTVVGRVVRAKAPKATRG